MAGNERELGVSITARNNTSSGVTGAATDLDRLNLAIKAVGGSFAGLTAQQLRAVEAAVGLAKGTLDARQALEAQAAAQGQLAASTVTASTAVQQQTAYIKENVAALNEQATASVRAMEARDAAIAASARSMVRTPVVIIPPTRTEGQVIPNEASIRLRAVRQAEAEAEALAIARASVLRRQTAPDFWAGHETRMGQRNAPLDAEASGDVFQRHFAERDAGAAAVQHREFLPGVNQAAGLDQDRQILSAAASARTLSTSLSAAAAQDSYLRDQALEAAEALKVQQRAMASLEATTNLQSLAKTSTSRFQNESMIYATVAATKQWEDALKTTGVAAENAQPKIDSLYNAGSVQRRTLQEGINASLLSQQAAPSLAGKASMRQDAAAAFGGKIELGAPISSGTEDIAERVGLGDKAITKLKTNSQVMQNELRHVTAIVDEGFRGQRGQIAGTIGAALRDAGLSAGALATSFGAFVAIAAGAAVLNAAKNLGEWAEAAKAGAVAAGMSIEEYTKLQGAMLLVGGKAADADVAMRHLSETMTTAMGDPGSKAAKAFNALGITQEMLLKNGGSVSGMITMLSGQLQGYGDSAAKSAAAEEILGRGMEKFLKLVDQGPEGLEKLKTQAEEMGYTLTAKTGAALTETGQKVIDLEMKSGGDFKKGMEAWGPEINHIIDGLGLLSHALADIWVWSNKFSQVVFKIPSEVAGQAEAAADWLANKAGLPPMGKAAQAKYGTPAPADSGIIKPIKIDPTMGIKKEVSPDWEGKDKTISEGKLDLQSELAKARQDAAGKTTSTAQLEVNKIRAEIKVYDAHIKSLQVSGAGMPGLLSPEGKTTRTPENNFLEQLQTERANKEAELSAAQLRDSTRGQPTESNKISDAVAQAKQAADSLSGTTKDAAISSAEAAIGALQHVLETEKLTAKKRLQVTTELYNAQRALHDKLLADTQSKQIEEIKTTVTVTTQQQKSDEVSAKFDALASGKPENSFAQAKAESLQVLASGEEAIKKLQDMATAGNLTTESIIKINEAIQNIKTDTMSRMIELFNEAGAAAKTSADIFASVWSDTFEHLDKSMDEFASDLTKAVIAPQQELIKAGLTTIHVSLEGNEIRAAAQKIFLGLASDFTSSVMKGLSEVVARNLFGNILAPPGTGVGGAIANWIGGGKTGSGQANAMGIDQKSAAALGGAGGVGKDGGLTSATAGLQAFSAALKTATKAVGTQGNTAQEAATADKTEAGASEGSATAKQVEAGATQTATTAQAVNASTTTVNTGAKAADTAGTTVHASAVEADTGGFITHALDLAADAAAEIYHTIVTLLSLEGGGVIPSAAGGMVLGGGLGGARGGTLAILHPHEMVLPRHLSEGVQGMINGGSRGSSGGNNIQSSTLNYSPQINAGRGGMSKAEMGQMLTSQAGRFTGEARNLMRRGWRP